MSLGCSVRLFNNTAVKLREYIPLNLPLSAKNYLIVKLIKNNVNE